MRSILAALASLGLLVSTSAQVPSYVPTNGLVGWWPFHGNANDESGNGNNGNVNGPTLTNDRFSFSSSAFEFDGVDDYVLVYSDPTLDLTNEFSFSFWISPRAGYGSGGFPNGDENHIISRWGLGGAGQASYQAWIDQTGAIGAGTFNGSTGSILTSNYTSPIDEWHNVIVVFSNSTTRIYVDAQVIDSLPFSVTPQSSFYNVNFGREEDGNYAYYRGSLDDIGIWNRALTPAEITALYNGVSAPCVSATPVSFTGLGTSYTLNDGPVTLTGSPANGVFIGSGVTGSTFDPAAAGVGTHSITYTYVDGTNCINTAGQCTEVTLNTTTGGTHMAEGGVHIFPNPANGLFNVDLDLQGLVSLQVFDAAGQLAHSEVFQCNGGRTIRTLNLVGMAKGGYTVQVQNKGGTVTQQVIID